MSTQRPANLMNLSEMLPLAEKGGFAIGAFSARYTAMILPILQAAQQQNSPLIVQIAKTEFDWFGNNPASFADEFYRCLEEEGITVPVGLHLDHTRDINVIKAAIAAGFTSVMIDASDEPLNENIALTRRVAAIAHTLGLAVEGELGRITTTDKLEADDDVEMFTQPEEAETFVNRTQVDALAVSIGTAHGMLYTVKQPKIDFERLLAIRERTAVHLVLHGGSGVPPEMMRKAYTLPGGGVSKINIATDLEGAALAALGCKRMTDLEMSSLPPEKLELARAAVKGVVMDKMINFLDSAGKANVGV